MASSNSRCSASKVVSNLVPMDSVLAADTLPRASTASQFNWSRLKAILSLERFTMHPSPDEQTVFGYLSALHSPEHGFFGGYLLVSSLGRPLEFHCTAPVRPSRAQEILYGPTLPSYLVGEQIGSTLLAAAQLTPSLILTDHVEAIGALRPATVPLVLVLSRQASDNAGKLKQGLDDESASTQTCGPVSAASHLWSEPLAAFNYQVRHASGSETRRAEIVALLAKLAERVDLAEPFGRIHEAIREAQRIGRHHASDDRGQAA